MYSGLANLVLPWEIPYNPRASFLPSLNEKYTLYKDCCIGQMNRYMKMCFCIGKNYIVLILIKGAEHTLSSME